MLRFSFTVLAIVAFATPDLSFAEGGYPTSLIRIPESVKTVFVAETSTSTFHQFDNSGGSLVLANSFYMSIGQSGPGKQRSGDKRTPLGLYFVTEQLDMSKLHEKYGVAAYPLDYPNVWDQQAGRDGDGIWVHGVHPEGGRRPERDTDGCIALPNEDLKLLQGSIEDNVTPVLVTQQLDWSDNRGDAPLMLELESAVSQWASSKANGDLHAYLSSYDADFRRWGMSNAEWSALFLQPNGFRGYQSAQVEDLLLIAYPEEEDLYLSRFRLTVSTAHEQIDSIVRLYWRREESGALKIVAEDVG
ncbi:MAG: L,D-transpeptidase family protein [Woeseiaceae bacterium]|nr:L,D-transpeptidase family protein [Woeseiaceae bacterium]